MRKVQKKCACTAATVTSARHNEYNRYYSSNAAARQAAKNRRVSSARMQLTMAGLLLSVMAAGANDAGLLGGSATAFVVAVGLLAMWGCGRKGM